MYSIFKCTLDTGASDSEKTDKNISLGYKVAMQLMEAYQRKGHYRFIHNLYISPSLLLNLLDKGTYCKDTVHTNRRNLQDALNIQWGLISLQPAGRQNLPLLGGEITGMFM